MLSSNRTNLVAIKTKRLVNLIYNSPLYELCTSGRGRGQIEWIRVWSRGLAVGQLPTNGNARNPGRNPPLEYFKGTERSSREDALDTPEGSIPLSLSLPPRFRAARVVQVTFYRRLLVFSEGREGIKRGWHDSKGRRKVGQERRHRVEERGWVTKTRA